MGGAGFATLQLVLSLILAPLLPGIVNRTKALIAGRTGRPLLQGYRDIAKLLGKAAVYSRTTGWVFRAGPTVGLAAAAASLAMIPWAGGPTLVRFEGDLVLFAGLLGLGRFITIAAALDTGSAFEGMGASRDAWFSALAEPALLLGLAALARGAGGASLSAILAGSWLGGKLGATLLLAAGAFCVVFVAENARMPVDDPTTHLELTMIHEVMVLDHAGVDLAYIQYGACLKLWALGGLLVSLLAPGTGSWLLDIAVGLGGLAAVAGATGVAESVMARLRLVRVPQLLVAGIAMSALALALALAG
jgi:formate hydrogenlyase subunit 4